MSLIETSLEKMRRAASSQKETAAATVLPAVARLEPVASLEPRPAHKRTTIDFARLRAAGYLPDEAQDRRFADYCHRIKRPIIDRALAAGTRDHARMILLSSALPGDGKTFVALNLALSMARERDISVLLIDGDLPRAQMSRVLGLDHAPGVLAALHDDALDVESLVFDTEVSGLEVLPAGGPLESAAELVASARMREIAARLIARNPRRLVLVDTPPLLVSIEARALIQIPGQIVVVARAGHTPRHAVVEALTHVDKSRLAGLIVNDGYVSGDPDYYHYGYGSHGNSG